jgi:integrase/recombinase XerD
LLADYPEASGRFQEKSAPLFPPIRNNRTGELDRTLSGDGIHKLVRAYAERLGVTIGVHALRATAATNALEHEADIAKVQEWLGHANIATTRLYDRRKSAARRLADLQS